MEFADATPAGWKGVSIACEHAIYLVRAVYAITAISSRRQQSVQSSPCLSSPGNSSMHGCRLREELPPIKLSRISSTCIIGF